MDIEQLNKPPTDSTSDRIQAILAKATGGIPKTIGSAATTPEPEAPSATETQEPAAEGAGDPEPEPAATEDKPGEKPAKPEPKTARAKEWADIKETKRELSEALRDMKRATAQLTKDRADFVKVQEAAAAKDREYAELDRLRREKPAEFVKRLGSGNMREVLKAAIEEPEETPEQRELRELREWRKTVEDRETAREKAELEAREKAEQDQRERGQREFHSNNLRTVRGVMEAQAAALPVVSRQTKAAQGLIAREAYTRILTEFERTGRDPNILDVLSALEKELFQEQQASETEPPAQAAGAVETAKPEAKRTPVLSSAAATSRAASPRPLTYEEKLRAASRKLRRA